MAVITTAPVVAQGGDPTAHWAVYAIRGVTTGDTYDVSATPVGFSRVFSAIFIASTLRTAVAVVSVIAGTVITMSSTGLAGDGGYLFVVGEQ